MSIPATVFVRNLNYSLNESSIKAKFEEAGEIDKIELFNDSNNNFKGYAYITYKDSESSKNSIKMFHNKVLFGRKLHLQFHDLNEYCAPQEENKKGILRYFYKIKNALSPSRKVKFNDNAIIKNVTNSNSSLVNFNINV